MLHLTTEDRTTLVCTADPDIKMKRGQKVKPYRLLPIDDVVVNGGYPLTFVVRTLNSYEQMEVASEINETPATRTACCLRSGLRWLRLAVKPKRAPGRSFMSQTQKRSKKYSNGCHRAF